MKPLNSFVVREARLARQRAHPGPTGDRTRDTLNDLRRGARELGLHGFASSSSPQMLMVWLIGGHGHGVYGAVHWPFSQPCSLLKPPQRDITRTIPWENDSAVRLSARCDTPDGRGNDSALAFGFDAALALKLLMETAPCESVTRMLPTRGRKQGWS